MRRLVALLLAQALAVSPVTTASAHVHDYADHDHPEHHHAPATHEHALGSVAPHHDHDDDHDDTASDSDPAFEASNCDPGRHSIALTLTCGCVPQLHASLAITTGAEMVLEANPVRAAVPLLDLRVHGPPARASLPSRAPPLPHLA